VGKEEKNGLVIGGMMVPSVADECNVHFGVPSQEEQSNGGWRLDIYIYIHTHIQMRRDTK
jgi:hypothetical protein